MSIYHNGFLYIHICQWYILFIIVYSCSKQLGTRLWYIWNGVGVMVPWQLTRQQDNGVARVHVQNFYGIESYATTYNVHWVPERQP